MKGSLVIKVNFNYKMEGTSAEINVHSKNINAHDVTTALAEIVGSMCDRCPDSDRNEFMDNFICNLFENDNFRNRMDGIREE